MSDEFDDPIPPGQMRDLADRMTGRTERILNERIAELEAEVERLSETLARRDRTDMTEPMYKARIDAALELVRLWRGDDPGADVITTAQLVGGLETALTGADE